MDHGNILYVESGYNMYLLAMCILLKQNKSQTFRRCFYHIIVSHYPLHKMLHRMFLTLNSFNNLKTDQNRFYQLNILFYIITFLNNFENFNECAFVWYE